jgi:hypothetical protein
MPADARKILRYLRECYRENGSRGGLWNLFSDSVSHRVFLKDQDFLAERPEANDTRYLRESGAETAARQALLHRKEKDLVYLSVFIIGRVETQDSQPKTICAPLFLFPARLDTSDLKHGAALKIDLSRRQINLPVIEAIAGSEFAGRLDAAIDPMVVSEGCVGEVRRLFAEAFPDADTDALLQYPHLIEGGELKAHFDSSKAHLVLLPAACVALVNKSTEMRGVLNELDFMADSKTTLSPPVRVLVGEIPSSETPAPSGKVPVTLSEAQQAVIRSARQHPLTLAIGPPGTGKSFTIAALAIETLSRGGSVLIASKMDHAVDVVGRKIEESIGLEGVVTRGGRSEYLKQLKQFIDDLLAGMLTSDAPDSRILKEQDWDIHRLETQIGHLSHQLAKKRSLEQKRGRLLNDPAPGFFRRFAQKHLKKRLSSTIHRESPIWDTAAEFERLIDARNAAVTAHLRSTRLHQLNQVLNEQRQVLQNFSRALKSRSGTRQESYFNKIGIRRLLGALPVWLVNLSDVHRILPLECAAFDLAIIDEATQCDIASALPVLQRARRAVITGDPKQLRHLSFLPKARQAAIASQFGLDGQQAENWNFRDVSLLDLVSESVTDQTQVAFLNEHFRSRPQIIAFSNREFYGGKLHIMTGHRKSGTEWGSALQVERLPDGKRIESGANPLEAQAVLDVIEAIRKSQSDSPAHDVQSIGILSPFRDQVDHLQRLVSRHQQTDSLLRRHDLLVGTAHSFQGEERDLMFISLALDDDSPSACFRFLEKPDVFNVAMTRARLLNRVWHSFDPARLSPDSLTARFLASASSHVPHCPEIMPARDAFVAEIAASLANAGAEVWPHFSIAGMELDVVYSLDGNTRGIDLIGFPGEWGEPFPIERMLTFRRASLPIIPLPFSAWTCQRERCLAQLTGRS